MRRETTTIHLWWSSWSEVCWLFTRGWPILQYPWLIKHFTLRQYPTRCDSPFPFDLLRTLNQSLINVSHIFYLVSAFNVCWECPVSNLCPWACLTWRDFITWGNKLGTRAKHTHQAPKQSKLEHNLNFIKGRAIFWTPFHMYKTDLKIKML